MWEALAGSLLMLLFTSLSSSCGRESESKTLGSMEFSVDMSKSVIILLLPSTFRLGFLLLEP